MAEEWPGVHVTVSADVTREWREYERTSTAVLNAYVQPRAAAYVAALDGTLRDARLGASRPAGRAAVFAMQSNGGATTLGEAARTPINLLESGPVAGVFGAAVLGRALGIADLISLDVGGTTAKCSLVRGGEVTISTDYRVERTPRTAGYPVRVPVVDIVEIGAGGGSLAWRDDAGAPRVGPRSAGALPGPVCYGLGNAEPTVTDAALVAGRIDAARYLGGRMEVDAELARAALDRFGAALGLDADATALGILRLANAHMISALGLVSVQRGHDPRLFTLVASGGGGALHAAELAAELRIARVLIPPLPAVFSAWGMLVSDVRRDVVRTRVLPAAQAAPSDGRRRVARDGRRTNGLLPRRRSPGRPADPCPPSRGAWSCAMPGRNIPSPSLRRPGRLGRDAGRALRGVSRRARAALRLPARLAGRDRDVSRHGAGAGGVPP